MGSAARHGRLVVIELTEVFLIPAFDASAGFQRRMLSTDGPVERLLTITSCADLCLRPRADEHLGVAVFGVVGALAALSALPGASGPKLSGTLASSLPGSYGRFGLHVATR